jgi:ribosome-associated protein
MEVVGLGLARYDAREGAKQAARAAAEKKALDILIYDVRRNSDVADYMVILGADSSTHMRAVYEGIVAALQDTGMHPLRQDGHVNNRWIALDYGGFLVHILLPEARTFYRLENLWESPRRVAWEMARTKGRLRK